MKKNGRIEQIIKRVIEEAKAENYPENHYPTSWKEYNFAREKGVRYMANVMNVVRMYNPVPDEVTAAEKGLLLRVMPFIEAESGMLYYRSDRIHKPLTVCKLAAKLGISASHTYRLVRRLCNVRVLAKESGRLYINPCYFFRGRYLSHHLYTLFKPELDAVLPEWVIQAYDGVV